MAITGLAVDVLSAKSVVRRMESGRKPERAVRRRRATPVRTGWHTDLSESQMNEEHLDISRERLQTVPGPIYS